MAPSIDTLRGLCGQLIMGGFEGQTLPERYGRALAKGERCGAILFKRNIGDIEQTSVLCRAITDASAEPPLVAVDQEGGRVSRLPQPFSVLPPMRQLAALDDVDLTRAAAAQVARELRALGFNLNFAPVMDVDSNPDNPIIGDRAFGAEPRSVMRHGIAFVRGLQEQHVLACAKHFPGHGDTALDSHVDLPHVDADGKHLSYVELPPFRAASGAGVASMMSAHVVYRALDEEVPATFSRAILTNLLRREIGFEGVLFSDDLEMGAIEKHHAIDHAAPTAVWAGCDVLLICHDQDKQDAALEALVERASRDDFFRKRCEEAAQRVARIRQLCPPKPAERSRLGELVGGRDSRLITDEIAARVAAREASEEEQGS